MIVEINHFYEIDNLLEECILWYNVWKNKNTGQSEMKNISFIILLVKENSYPEIYIALTIALTLPVTSCSVERTFSTLRKVKTWTRNTISDNRLNGLCMIAVHKEFVKNQKLE
jgi:hypothetical protein